MHCVAETNENKHNHISYLINKQFTLKPGLLEDGTLKRLAVSGLHHSSLWQVVSPGFTNWVQVLKNLVTAFILNCRVKDSTVWENFGQCQTDFFWLFCLKMAQCDFENGQHLKIALRNKNHANANSKQLVSIRPHWWEKNLEIILMKNNYFLWFSRNVLYLLHKSFDSHARKFPSHCPFFKPIIPFKLLFLYLAADVSSWISLVGKLTGRLIPNILQSVVLTYGTDCSCIKKETCLPRSWIQVVRWLKWRDRGMLETSKEGCDAGFLFCFLKPV